MTIPMKHGHTFKAICHFINFCVNYFFDVTRLRIDHIVTNLTMFDWKENETKASGNSLLSMCWNNFMSLDHTFDDS